MIEQRWSIKKRLRGISRTVETMSANVKSKINVLRAKLGREIGKESKTDSGPATSEQ